MVEDDDAVEVREGVAVLVELRLVLLVVITIVVVAGGVLLELEDAPLVVRLPTPLTPEVDEGAAEEVSLQGGSGG